MPRWPRARPQRAADAAGRHRPDRPRQARTVRHPLQPDRNRPPHPGFARGRSQHARPCGRPSGDDRRRSAHRARRAGRRRRRRSPPAPRQPPQPRRTAARPRCRRSARPELPNPAAAQAPSPTPPHFAAAPREFHAAPRDFRPQPPALPLPPKAISEILEPHAAPPRAPRSSPICRRIIRWSRARGRAARSASPSERIAASESAISEIPAATREPVVSSSFIAAARRAAQAAAAQPANDKASRAAAKAAAGQAAKDGKDKTEGAVDASASKIRSLLVGASVVVIVLGTFKMAMTLLDGGSPPPPPAVENSSDPAPQLQPPADAAAKPARRTGRCRR